MKQQNHMMKTSKAQYKQQQPSTAAKMKRQQQQNNNKSQIMSQTNYDDTKNKNLLHMNQNHHQTEQHQNKQ